MCVSRLLQLLLGSSPSNFSTKTNGYENPRGVSQKELVKGLNLNTDQKKRRNLPMEDIKSDLQRNPAYPLHFCPLWVMTNLTGRKERET